MNFVRKKIKKALSFLLLCCFIACKKEYRNPDYADIKVRIENYWNDSLLTSNRWNIFNYVSCNHDTCSLSKVECIISRFTFYKDGKAAYTDSSKAIYCNGGHTEFVLDSVPCKIYDSLSFNVGENYPANKNDIQINNMSWPESMGGGYHFLKYEGFFLKNNIPSGFALHAGGKHLSSLKITYKSSVNNQFINHQIIIRQNIEKWISGNIYCFNLSSNNYTMGNDTLMNMLLKNGKHAFNISYK